MPWPGFFDKMKQADHYVYLDSVQYRKNYFQNRNKVIDRNDVVSWLSVPVKFDKDEWTQPFHMVKISPLHPWKNKYLGKITSCYSKYPFFKKYYPEIEHIINNSPDTICKLNIEIINFFRNILNINTKTSFSSEIITDLSKSELLAHIAFHLNADTYLSGPSGKEYLNTDIFYENEIDVTFHEFNPPNYTMKNFIPGLSTLDIIMRYGDESQIIISQSDPTTLA